MVKINFPEDPQY